MTTVEISKTGNGQYQRILCSGHAGFAGYGKDIVCAAVSILVINTINSLDELVQEELEVRTDEKTGFIDCQFTKPLSEKGTLLIDSMILGLTHIVESYDKKYLQLRIKEV